MLNPPVPIVSRLFPFTAQLQLQLQLKSQSEWRHSLTVSVAGQVRYSTDHTKSVTMSSPSRRPCRWVRGKQRGIGSIGLDGWDRGLQEINPLGILVCMVPVWLRRGNGANSQSDHGLSSPVRTRRRTPCYFGFCSSKSECGFIESRKQLYELLGFQHRSQMITKTGRLTACVCPHSDPWIC